MEELHDEVTSWQQTDLHEQGEPLVFLLPALDELQRGRLVAAEGPHCSLYLLLFLTAELQQTQTFTPLFPPSCLNINPERPTVRSRTLDSSYPSQEIICDWSDHRRLVSLPDRRHLVGHRNCRHRR